MGEFVEQKALLCSVNPTYRRSKYFPVSPTNNNYEREVKASTKTGKTVSLFGTVFYVNCKIKQSNYMARERRLLCFNTFVRFGFSFARKPNRLEE